MRYIPALLLLAAFAIPLALTFSVRAADDVIKVINEDGSASVINIGPNGGASVIAPEPAPSVSETIAEPVREPVKQAPAKPKAKKKKKAVPQQIQKEKKAAAPVAAPKIFIPPGHEITREEAMAIAIENSSMITRGLDAFPRTLDGRKVWVVVFKTDQGERDILVDSKTGEIVRVKN